MQVLPNPANYCTRYAANHSRFILPAVLWNLAGCDGYEKYHPSRSWATCRRRRVRKRSAVVDIGSLGTASALNERLDDVSLFDQWCSKPEWSSEQERQGPALVQCP